jgi:hypothetical protein
VISAASINRQEITMNQRHLKQSIIAGAIALALGATGHAFANDNTNSKTSDTTTTSSTPTGKQKATAIGAGSGAAVGAVVGGPVGALVGAGVGAYVGHQGTDANGRVNGNATTANGSMAHGNSDTRRLQQALNAQGYNLAVDGIHGPATENALRDFQSRNGLTQGPLDESTRARLGLNS